MRYPIIMALVMGLALQGCRTVDLRTPYLKENLTYDSHELETKGTGLLETSWKLQGMDRLMSHSSIQFVGHEAWRSLIGKLGNPWRLNNELLQFEYAINTFDGRVTILSGRKTGTYFGLQSWQYYEGNERTPPDFNVKKDKKRAFAIPTFHYLTELPNRLKNAPLKLYAGATMLLGKDYEMVLVTWGTNSKPTKAHDQYLVYISKETGLMELVSYSAHEGYLPGRHSFYGSIRYSDFKKVGGILIPMKHETLFGKIKKNKKPIHTLEIKSFLFDGVANEVLYPKKNLYKTTDEKPKKSISKSSGNKYEIFKK